MKCYSANFHSDRLLDTDIREVPSLKKKTKAFGMDIFFPPRRSNLINVLWKYFSNYVFFKDMYKNVKEIGMIQAVPKLTIFVNL